MAEEVADLLPTRKIETAEEETEEAPAIHPDQDQEAEEAAPQEVAVEEAPAEEVSALDTTLSESLGELTPNKIKLINLPR